MKSLKCIVMAFVLIFSVAFFSSCDANNRQVIIINVYDEIHSLDPLLASNSTEIAMAHAAFYNLFEFDEDGEIAPLAAKNYSFTLDALTIELHQDLYWANGDKLTADCFLFSLQRAIKIADNSPLTFYLEPIKNARNIMNGTAPYSELGVSINDEFSLTIHFEVGQVNENFLHTLTLPIAAPTNRAFFENTRGRYGLTHYHTLTNGAYTFTTFTDSLIRLRPNANHHDETLNSGINLVPTSQNIDATNFVDSRHAHLAIGRAFVFSDTVSLPFLEVYQEIYALHTNPSNKYLSAANIHSALNLAIDNLQLKEQLNDLLSVTCNLTASDITFRGRQIPSELLRQDCSTLHSFNPTLALELFQGVFPTGTDTPSITLLFEDVPELQQAAAQIAQSWQAHLNFHVRIVGLQRGELLRRIEGGNFDIALRPLSVPNACLVALSREFSNTSVFTNSPQNQSSTLFAPATNYNEMLDSFEQFNSNFSHNNSLFTPLFEASARVFYQPRTLTNTPTLHPNGHINFRRLQ